MVLRHSRRTPMTMTLSPVSVHSMAAVARDVHIPPADTSLGGGRLAGTGGAREARASAGEVYPRQTADAARALALGDILPAGRAGGCRSMRFLGASGRRLSIARSFDGSHLAAFDESAGPVPGMIDGGPWDTAREF